MAKKVTITIIDDTDETIQADENVTFGLDSADYEIDLSSGNATKLRNILDPWINSARKKAREKTPKKTNTIAIEHEQNIAIRAWARTQGHTISSRGRIPVEILAAYNTKPTD